MHIQYAVSTLLSNNYQSAITVSSDGQTISDLNNQGFGKRCSKSSKSHFIRHQRQH